MAPRWQSAPLVEDDAPRWASAPLVGDERDDVGALRHGQSSFVEGLNTIQDITPLSALLNSAATGVDLVNWGREKITGAPVESNLAEDIRNLTPTRQSAKALRQSGVTTDAVPDTDTERFVSTAARITGSALPFAAAGPLASGLIAAGGSGIGGATAERMFPDSTIAPIIGALAGGIGASTSAGAAGGVRSFLRGKSSADDVAQAVDDFRSVTGMTPSAATATGSRVLGVGEGLQRRFFGGAPLKNRRAAIGDATAKAVDDITPSASNPEAVGRRVIGGIDGFVKRTSERGGKLYDKLGDIIPPAQKVPITNTLSILDDVSRPVPGAEKLSVELAESGVVRLLQAASDDAASGGLTFQALNRLRSAIGERLSGKSLVDDISTGTYKRIYGAISDDIREAANRAGPEAVKAFNRANSFWGQTQGFIKNRLNPIAKKATPEAVYNSLVSGGKNGSTMLRAVRAAVPKDVWDDMSQTYAQRLGRPAPGAQNVSGDAFDIGTFLTNWNKITPDARSALFGGNAASMNKSLSRIARMADRLKAVDRFLPNPSNSGETVALQATAGLLATSILGGNLPAAAQVGGGILANHAVARLMTSPFFVNWLAKGGSVPVNRAPAYAAALLEMSEKEKDQDVKRDVEDFVNKFLSASK